MCGGSALSDIQAPHYALTSTNIATTTSIVVVSYSSFSLSSISGKTRQDKALGGVVNHKCSTLIPSAKYTEAGPHCGGLLAGATGEDSSRAQPQKRGSLALPDDF